MARGKRPTTRHPTAAQEDGQHPERRVQRFHGNLRQGIHKPEHVRFWHADGIPTLSTNRGRAFAPGSAVAFRPSADSFLARH